MADESQPQLSLDLSSSQSTVPSRPGPPSKTAASSLDPRQRSGTEQHQDRLAGRRREAMLLTVRDVEAELQLGRTRTYELLRSGGIPVIRLGRALRVPRDALRRWIDENCSAAAGGSSGGSDLRSR